MHIIKQDDCLTVNENVSNINIQANFSDIDLPKDPVPLTNLQKVSKFYSGANRKNLILKVKLFIKCVCVSHSVGTLSTFYLKGYHKDGRYVRRW